MLVAVFGMRLLFPVAIVALATGIDLPSVANMALKNPSTYAEHLNAAHVNIAAFGGMFLLLVFLSFLFDDAKELHWLGLVEKKLALFGKLESLEIIIALTALLVTQQMLPEALKLPTVTSGLMGIILYVLINSLAALFEEGGEELSETLIQGSLMSFLYLEILDASFSFDGVIGAFAITQDVVIIMLGLAIGAMFVRSLTVFLVRQGTLDEYVFLEHGAHYAIGALAIIMLVSITHEIPEIVTGSIGAILIGLSVYSSIQYRRHHPD